MSNSTKYEQLSFKRKQLQADGLAPEWYSTASYQLLTEKNYLESGETPKDMYERVANRAAELTNFDIPEEFGYETWNEAFIDVMWKGWVSPSTTVLTNMGSTRGHPVSCAGTYLPDSIRGFYETRLELAQLTQRGYGTSVSLDPVRRRGSPISAGGSANGIMQPATGIVDDMSEVSQGNTRRGSCGQYLNPMHGDFDELADQLIADNEGWNIGWNITDAFGEMFTRDLEEADRLWKRMMRIKMLTGKGYFFFVDKVNRAAPRMYKDRGFKVRHSNLCAEIALMNDILHTFSCVLSSMNVAKYDEWKDTFAVQIATIFLDAVVSDMLEKAKQEPGFERIIAFTEKSRAIGLGQLGQSTYFQQQGWEFGDMQSSFFNKKISKLLHDETLIASKLLAKEVGEPEWMEGYGERFSHRTAYPPTKSTAIIQGGISEGINPVFANVYEQDTAGGTVYRINPPLLKLMKERGMYNKDVMRRIAEDQGSVQAEDWLTEAEKRVFKTSFEVNQTDILRMAGDRQPNVCQSQSTNLFITADESEEEISRLHDIAFNDEQIHSLYYVNSLNKAMKHKVDKTECSACEG